MLIKAKSYKTCFMKLVDLLLINKKSTKSYKNMIYIMRYKIFIETVHTSIHIIMKNAYIFLYIRYIMKSNSSYS